MSQQQKQPATTSQSPVTDTPETNSPLEGVSAGASVHRSAHRAGEALMTDRDLHTAIAEMVDRFGVRPGEDRTDPVPSPREVAALVGRVDERVDRSSLGQMMYMGA